MKEVPMEDFLLGIQPNEEIFTMPFKKRGPNYWQFVRPSSRKTVVNLSHAWRTPNKAFEEVAGIVDAMNAGLKLAGLAIRMLREIPDKLGRKTKVDGYVWVVGRISRKENAKTTNLLRSDAQWHRAHR